MLSDFYPHPFDHLSVKGAVRYESKGARAACGPVDGKGRWWFVVHQFQDGKCVEGHESQGGFETKEEALAVLVPIIERFESCLNTGSMKMAQ